MEFRAAGRVIGSFVANGANNLPFIRPEPHLEISVRLIGLRLQRAG
jgi:hypothetical protein